MSLNFFQERKYYQPKKRLRGDYHSERFPSTYVNPNEVWCNQKNPISGKPKPWAAKKNADPIELMLNHITSDSWLTVKICDVSIDWLQKAAEGKLEKDEYMPGKSKYLRLVNDTAERLVRAADDTSNQFSVLHV